jgi:hypothetical protein
LGDENNLGKSVSVTQVNENKFTVIPAAGYPSAKRHFLANIISSQLTTSMGS